VLAENWIMWFWVGVNLWVMIVIWNRRIFLTHVPTSLYRQKLPGEVNKGISIYSFRFKNFMQKDVLLITTGFLDFVHHPEFYKQENTTFRKLDLFLSSGERGGGAPTLLGTLEKTYLNHRRCQTRRPTTRNKSTIYSWHQDESMGCNRKTQSKKLWWK
jgi:hypothetical protein